MYTLTRKLSVVCLTVVLSFLAYGCGGGSKQALITDVSSEQALITDVSTDMVTAGLTPDQGTYTIQPGGTANAGDVTFACPAGGPTCKITVASDGTIMSVEGSADGMATAMDSASAAARLAAEQRATDAEAARDAAVTARMEAEAARDAAITARMDAETATDSERVAAAEAALLIAEQRATDAEAAQTTAENMRDAAVTARMEAEAARDAAVTARMDAEAARDVAVTARMEAEAAIDPTTDTARVMAAEAALLIAEQRATAAEAALLIAEQRATAAEEFARQLTMVTQIKTDLATGFDKVTAGTYALISGGFIEVDDVRIACPANVGIPCTVVITVSSAGDASYTSLGGVATVVNTSAVEHTRMAIALTGEAAGLNAQAAAGEEGAPLGAGEDEDPIGVKRSPRGTTTITPVHVSAEDATGMEVKYKSVSVDRGHRITGWIGQTLTRDDGAEATEDVDAVPAVNIDEATFYTNIESAESGKLKYKAGQLPLSAHEDYLVFAIDKGQDAEDFTEEFTGYFIRKSDGGKIRGTFTCNADVCTPIDTDDIPTIPSDEGNLILETATLVLGWTFESNSIVPEGEIPDTNYMYFGYWLKSPVAVSDISSSYKSATFSGGNALFNVMQEESGTKNGLTDDSHALTAKYEGGAAGRYVTRELRVKSGAVDPNSPGSHGRFTAKAKLTATFGTHDSFAGDEDADPEVVSRQNKIHGTISDFKDGSIDLGFEVTLGMRDIEVSLGGIDNAETNDGVVTATFGQNDDNGPTTGRWTGEFYGANAAETASDAVKNRTLPSGVAGEFTVGTDTGFTQVVGAFAAERTQ